MEGNQMKMREAVEAALTELDKFGQCHDARIHFADIVHIGRARGMLQAALALPRRQCDVGTAEEQIARHDLYCRAQGRCDRCDRCIDPVAKDDFNISSLCKFQWLQMPYEEGDRDA